MIMVNLNIKVHNGIGSKILKKMGFQIGNSLGKNNNGILNPILVDNGFTTSSRQKIGLGAYKIKKNDEIIINKPLKEIKKKKKEEKKKNNDRKLCDRKYD